MQLETFERRQMRERYSNWVKKTTERYYAEQKKANEEAIARNKNK